jgi:hypothetical protein
VAACGAQARASEERYTLGSTEASLPAERPLVVHVDVDDTLVRSFGSKQIPMQAVIDKVRALANHNDVALYCWSSNGAEYARSVAARFGIAELFSGFMPKPNLVIDDQRTETRNSLLVVHPNELDDDVVAY